MASHRLEIPEFHAVICVQGRVSFHKMESSGEGEGLVVEQRDKCKCEMKSSLQLIVSIYRSY